MFKVTLTKLAPRLQIKYTNPVIENWAFKLHCRLTCALLVMFVLLVCARELIGDHIQCIAGSGVPANVINTYCFFMGTFTVVKNYNDEMLKGEHLPHPGVGAYIESKDKILQHRYYQWVPFVLFLQSVCFYMPHYIWKKKEGGRMKALVDGLQYGTACGEADVKFKSGSIPSKENLEKKMNIVKRDFMLRLSVTRTWSTWLVSMEIMNLINIFMQILIVDFFLSGQFIGLGLSVMGVEDWNSLSNPLDRIFPAVTKCGFQKYGPSGSIQKHDALCIMALNVTHEKIYTILWFWFLILFIISVIAVVWRIASFFLYHSSQKFNEIMFQRACTSKLDTKHVMRVVNCCQFADWLFLYYLAKNMHVSVFQELLARVAEELDNRELNRQGYKKIEPGTMFVDKIGFDDELLKDPKKAS